MGWAAGIERIMLAAGGVPAPEPPVDLFVAYEEPRREEAFTIVAHARRATKVALPSPYLLAQRMWDPARSRDAG